MSPQNQNTMKKECNNFKQEALKMTTEQLISLQDGMLNLKTNKEQMEQIEILEDIICERLSSNNLKNK